MLTAGVGLKDISHWDW